MTNSTIEAAPPPRAVALRPVDRGPGPRGAPPKRRSADALVQAFNSWAFKREQPDNAERLNALAAAAVESGRPLAFALYWGRGRREHVAAPERQCLDFLAALVRRVASAHAPGAAVTVICTDTHAALNGHPPLPTRRYFAEVEREAAERGFGACFLGDLVGWAKDRIDKTRADERPSPQILRALTASAAKHHREDGRPTRRPDSTTART